MQEGGHNIPDDVIRRRYENGLSNFFKKYIPIVNNWLFINNSGNTYEIVAEGTAKMESVNQIEEWNHLKSTYHGN